MKIAVVVSTYPPYAGGMGNVAQAHAEALTRAGHEVTVFAPDKSLRTMIRYGNARFVPQLWWKLRPFDIVELHYPFYGGAEAVWLWKKTFGRDRSLVVMYHMDTVGTGIVRVVSGLYRPMFLNPILNASDRIIVTSKDYAASSQMAAFANDAKTVAVPLAVDAKRFHPTVSIDGTMDTSATSALFVGGLDSAHYFKGLDVLLRALASCKGGRLSIVGDGNLRESYEALAKTLDIGGSVDFLGNVPNERLPEIYRNTAFHILPSVDRSEAFGLVTLEAAASGIPSIVSDLPGMRSVVTAGETGFVVPPGDAKALAEAMTKLFDEPGLAHRMGAAARRRVEELYATDVVDRQIVKAVVE